MFGNNIYASLSNLATAFVPVLLGIILHEVAHGWVASLCGDKTAKMLGRLTLNPVPHIDPMGLGMFVLTALLPGGLIFGWAKPVPVNARNMRKPRRDMMLVSAAGSVTNMLLACAFAVALRLMFSLTPPNVLISSTMAQFFTRMFEVGIVANFALAWINLLPIPPLDGSHIVEGLLPPRLAWKYSQLGRYGFMILLVLLFTGVVGMILMPLINFSVNGVISLTGLNDPAFHSFFRLFTWR